MNIRLKHFHTMKKGRKFSKRLDAETVVTGFDPDVVYKDRLVGTVAMKIVKGDIRNPEVYALGIVTAGKKDIPRRKEGALRASGRLEKFLNLIEDEDIHRIVEGGYLADPQGKLGKTSFNRGERPRELHGMPRNRACLMMASDFKEMVESGKFFKKNLNKFNW